MPGDLFVRGVVIGFAVAFALGPIGLLVIRRTIDRGWSFGLASGVGVATADATYGAIAAFGLTALTEILVGIDRPLGIVGGGVLLVLAASGLRDALRADDPVIAADADDRSAATAGQATAVNAPYSVARAAAIRRRVDHRVTAWATMVALTLTNPATILSFAALFASIGAGTGGVAGAAAVVVGVFLGSVAWWILLTSVVAGLRARLTPTVVRGLNVVSAAFIGGFGLVAIGLGITG